MLPLRDLIQCVDRELGFRLRVYPRWVNDRKMTPKTMNQELERMRAVRERLLESLALEAMVDELAKRVTWTNDLDLSKVREVTMQDVRSRFPLCP